MSNEEVLELARQYRLDRYNDDNEESPNPTFLFNRKQLLEFVEKIRRMKEL